MVRTVIWIWNKNVHIHKVYGKQVLQTFNIKSISNCTKSVRLYIFGLLMTARKNIWLLKYAYINNQNWKAVTKGIWFLSKQKWKGNQKNFLIFPFSFLFVSFFLFSFSFHYSCQNFHSFFPPTFCSLFLFCLPSLSHFACFLSPLPPPFRCVTAFWLTLVLSVTKTTKLPCYIRLLTV